MVDDMVSPFPEPWEDPKLGSTQKSSLIYTESGIGGVHVLDLPRALGWSRLWDGVGSGMVRKRCLRTSIPEVPSDRGDGPTHKAIRLAEGGCQAHGRDAPYPLPRTWQGIISRGSIVGSASV